MDRKFWIKWSNDDKIECINIWGNEEEDIYVKDSGNDLVDSVTTLEELEDAAEDGVLYESLEHFKKGISVKASDIFELE